MLISATEGGASVLPQNPSGQAWASDYRGLSLWLDRVDDPLTRRPGLPGDRSVDIAIVGAGFTGLWTAYYLQRADPNLRIAVVEKEIAGFGASGRNGGWCSDLFPASWEKIARRHGRAPALAMKAAMRAGLDEVGSVVAAEGLDCGWERGGSIAFARSKVQLERAEAEVEHAHSWGDSDADLRLLSATETQQMVGAAGVLGSTFTPHCATIDPGALVRGLARLVVDRGAELYEGTAVREIRPHRVVTDEGIVTADVVVRATEGYTSALRGARRELAPLYSLIVATEPLDEKTLTAVGLAHRPTFADHRHLICYGQRSSDGRIVFGGRGAPYHFGSTTAARFDREPAVFESLRHNLIDMFPVLAGVRFTHSWGGPLGVPRDWHAGVGLDRDTGFAWGGGYVGDGVTTSNLAGRTLTDLITGTDSDLITLPWVGHRSRKWEPEPLRYLGINTGLRVMVSADRRETRTGKHSSMAKAFNRYLGG
ncbi:FAD-binding oxidoreductase [Nakamurella sp. PAMC28650]|uniref:NAD(P)/FAD-dependent oxidoreductase n=1 Tax=Nakamurella sp. PAMC28650 TaxID=2762325 RepID=UPI00164E28F4|nr:FAD-binding oxidoreductase [Nakamurella sp. PAMC28650]QNK81645.1 FAD-dependent oxidoreductase [Nakamurella sp. PAMC28650]